MSIMTRHVMLVPSQYAQIIINHRLSPKPLWNELGGAIISNGDQGKCTLLLNWMIMATTRPTDASWSNWHCRWGTQLSFVTNMSCYTGHFFVLLMQYIQCQCQCDMQTDRPCVSSVGRSPFVGLTAGTKGKRMALPHSRISISVFTTRLLMFVFVLLLEEDPLRRMIVIFTVH
jgi:hypothetical protein